MDELINAAEALAELTTPNALDRLEREEVVSAALDLLHVAGLVAAAQAAVRERLEAGLPVSA